jgi:hypothetical protein
LVVSVVAHLFLALLGAYLAISGVLKLREPVAATRSSIDAYAIPIPQVLGSGLAVLLPAAETAVGVLLVSSLAVAPAVAATVVLLLGYAIAMISVLARGLSTDCGCHGSLSRDEVRPALVVRNLVLAALAIIGAAAAFGSGFYVTGPLSALGVAVAASLGVVLVVTRMARRPVSGR